MIDFIELKSWLINKKYSQFQPNYFEKNINKFRILVDMTEFVNVIFYKSDKLLINSSISDYDNDKVTKINFLIIRLLEFCEYVATPKNLKVTEITPNFNEKTSAYDGQPVTLFPDGIWRISNGN